MLEYGAQLAEGKTKIIYAHPEDAALAIMAHKDGISAGDGARRNTIVGKGALSGRTAANVFALLNRAGIATHYVGAPDDTTMLVRRCTMIPVEVVTRRLATGSFLRRYPTATEGQRFDPPLVEFFIKDDARHDPQITPAEMAAQSVATEAESTAMEAGAQQVFAVLERAWADQGITLVDLKIEFGRDSAGHLLVADVIDNDSWRLWPGGDKSQMLDKQVYRNMPQVTEDDLAHIRDLYAHVATLTDGWRAAQG